MQLEHLYHDIGPWLDGQGPLSDIVVSSRVRLARNIAGFLFFSHADPEQRAEVLEFVRGKVMASDLQDRLWYLNMEDTSELERHILAERHLISRQLANGEGSRGVAIAHDEMVAVMINEEDHLRIQALASGLQLYETYESISRIDDLLEQEMEFSFSSQYGYLTACPTNVGTGIRVSVMLHLPALKLTGQMDKVLQAAKELRLAVRGLYGEGSEPVGDFFQLSNQTTLGKSEKQIIADLITLAVEPLVQYERRARQKLLDDRTEVLDDKAFRALGVLRNARLISSEEALYLLSYVRLGIYLGRVKDVKLETANKLLLLIQPGHLQHLSQKRLDSRGRDESRARLIRQYLT